MPNLIDSSLLWPSQPPLRIYRILFQEKSAEIKAKKSEIRIQVVREKHAHLIARCQKVPVADMIVIPGRKLGLLAIE